MNGNAKKWVEALRSGKYRQTKYQLAKRGRYCCLGVGCEVARANRVNITVEKAGGNHRLRRQRYGAA